MKLSAEILRINTYAQLFHNQQNTKLANHYLICLDFLVKGVLIHWQVKLGEKNKSKQPSEDQLMLNDVKFPILLGDQYHSMAYFMITRLGNVEITKLLTLIEEGFWKIFFNVEQFGSDIQLNLKFIYEHYYNYLPQFMGNCFKGLGVINEMT